MRGEAAIHSSFNAYENAQRCFPYSFAPRKPLPRPGMGTALTGNRPREHVIDFCTQSELGAGWRICSTPRFANYGVATSTRHGRPWSCLTHVGVWYFTAVATIDPTNAGGLRSGTPGRAESDPDAAHQQRRVTWQLVGATATMYNS